MNTPIIVNAHKSTFMALKKALAGKLLELLDDVGWLEHGPVERFPSNHEQGFDLRVGLKLRGHGTTQLWVQCKADPRPSQFPSAFVVPEASNPPIPVLAAPFISPRLAEVCKEEGWGWFDLAGNCLLDIPGLLHLHQTGARPVHRPPRPTATLATPEAGRIIRALLHPEHAGTRWTQRYLAEHFGKMDSPTPQPSLGLVNKVVRHLLDEAFIEKASEGGFRVCDPLSLLFAWRDAYLFGRHDRRSYFTLLQGNKLREALDVLGTRTGGYTAYAAFSAAEFQAPHVRQPKTWLFIREQDISLFEELIAAKPVDSGENLVVLIPNDEGVFYLGDGGKVSDHRLACTNAVQTYVDLWHCGGRGQEAAEALLEQRLKPAWKAKDLKL
jgi:hypothetical protein